MQVFIGFDISLQSTHVCAGRSRRQHRQGGSRSSLDVSALDIWLRTHGKLWEIKRIVFETGQLSTYFYHGLCSILAGDVH